MTIRAVPFTNNGNFISERAFNEHMKLYANYVNKTNEIFHELSDYHCQCRGQANKTMSMFRELKRGESYAMDGVILHELYFGNISKNGQKPGPLFTNMVNRYFNDMEHFMQDFVACATAARGWCVTAYEQRTDTMRNILLDSHDDGNITSAYPILVLDMYEHAYMIDYGVDVAEYIRRFTENIRWDEIEQRLRRLPD